MYSDKLIEKFQNEIGIGNNFSYAIKQQYIKWLENKVESAMCEANSNAVLAEVRARIADDMREMKRTGTEHKTVGYIRALKIIDEYISENFS